MSTTEDDSMREEMSKPMQELTHRQHQINKFLWSSEIAYELIRSRILSKELSVDPNRRVEGTFPDLHCRAFIETTASRKQREKGNEPKYKGHYNPFLPTFDQDLLRNLEQVCRYVIVRFHSALEHYIWTRCKPFLRVEDTPIDQLPGKQRRKFKSDFQGTSYPRLQHELEKSYPFLEPIPQKTALLAQGFRLVRNEFIHKEDDWTPPWSDSAFQARVKSTFHGAEQKTI